MGVSVRLERILAALSVVTLLLGAVASSGAPLAAEAQELPDNGASGGPSSAVRMDVRAGWDGVGRLGGWIPLDVELVNQGPEVRAEVQVAVGQATTTNQTASRTAPTAPGTIFTLPVVLPKLSQKRFSLDANLPNVNTRATARLVDPATGALIAEQEIQMSRVPLGDYFCGILARDPSSYDFLSALELPAPIRRIRTAPLDPSSVPEKAQLLGSFDCIVIDNAATGQLRPEQLDALQVWVGTGGLLIAVGGPTWQSTLGPLPPGLLPVEIGGLTQVQSLSSIATLLDVPPDSGGTWLVSQSRPRISGGASVVAAQNGVPLIVAAKRGEGTVIYLAFEPTGRALQGWGGADQLWRYLVTHAGVDNGVGSALVRPYLRWGRVPRVGMADFTTQPRTSFDWLWKLVAGYGAIVAGGVYFLGRRGLTGWTVLGTAAVVGVTTAGAVAFARQNSEPDAAVTRLSVIRPIEVGDSAAAYTRDYVSVLAKRDGPFSFALSEDQLARGMQFSAPASASGTASPGGDDHSASATFRIRQGATPTFDGLALQQGQLATAVVDGQLRQAPGVQADLRVENTTLTGSLTNRTGSRLTDAFLVLDGNNFQRLGTIERDESRSVDTVLPRQASAGSMAASALAEKLIPQEATRQPGGAARRDLVESLFFDRFLFRRMEMRGPTLVAWLEKPAYPFQPLGFKTGNADFTLLVQPLQPKLPLGFEGEIPASVMNRRDLGIGSGAPSDQPYYTVAQGEAITLQFALPATEGRYALQQLRLNVEGSYTGRSPRQAQPPFTVSVFNWRQSRWDPWEVYSGSSIVPEPERYLSAVGEIRVRYALESNPNSPLRETRFTRFDVTPVGAVR